MSITGRPSISISPEVNHLPWIALESTLPVSLADYRNSLKERTIFHNLSQSFTIFHNHSQSFTFFLYHLDTIYLEHLDFLACSLKTDDLLKECATYAVRDIGTTVAGRGGKWQVWKKEEKGNIRRRRLHDH